MKKSLYIHIGTHKTGSTAIQQFLRQNKRRLAQEGVFYLTLPYGIEKLMSANELDEELVDSVKKSLANKANSYSPKKAQEGCYLLSWEGFSGDALKGYANVAIVAEHLQRMTEQFDVKIIVYLRRQDDFLESIYTQKIHEGASYAFHSFVEMLPDTSFDWARLLAAYGDRFGKENLIVRRYDKAFLPKSDSLLKDFLQIVGVDFNKLDVEKKELIPNRGYSRDALEIAKLANPYLRNEEKKRLRRILQNASAKQPFEKYAYWTSSERARFLERYNQSNAQVASHFFDEEFGDLFPIDNDRSEREQYGGLSAEAVAKVLAVALVMDKGNESQSIFLRLLMKMEQKLIGLYRKIRR